MIIMDDPHQLSCFRAKNKHPHALQKGYFVRILSIDTECSKQYKPIRCHHMPLSAKRNVNVRQRRGSQFEYCNIRGYA